MADQVQQGEKLKYIKDSPWYRLGFVNDTSEAIYCTVAGDENEGGVIGFKGNLLGKKVEYESGVVRDLKKDEPTVLEEDPFLEWIRTSYGKRYVRFPIGFIKKQSVRPLLIDRVVVDPSANREVDPALGNRIPGSLDAELKRTTVKKYGLYERIQRPTAHRNFDTDEGVRFSINSYATLHVINARPAFTIYSENLLQMASTIIHSYISKTILREGYKKYKQRGNKLSDVRTKDDAGNEKPSELDELNELLKEIGLKATVVIMSDPELHPDVQADMERVFRATQTADAKAEEGRGIGQYEENVGKGEAARIRAVAEANARKIGAVIETLTGKKDGTGTLIPGAERALEHVEALADADAVGRLQGTFAPGGNVGVHTWNRRPDHIERESEEVVNVGQTGSEDRSVGASVASPAPRPSTAEPREQRDKRNRRRR